MSLDRLKRLLEEQRGLPTEVAEALKHYVYVYRDPNDRKPFYIGKGKGSRVLDHFRDPSESEKTAKIASLKAQGKVPDIEFLRYGLLSDDQARLVEATAIDLIGTSELTNAMRGHSILGQPSVALEELLVELEAKPFEVQDDLLLIRISVSFNSEMDDVRLYDLTRSAWKLNPARAAGRLALSVYRGLVREVYEVAQWLPAGSTLRHDCVGGLAESSAKSRWEFVGRVAPEPIRARYRFQRVPEHLFPKGLQNPIRYVDRDGSATDAS